MKKLITATCSLFAALAASAAIDYIEDEKSVFQKWLGKLGFQA